MLKLELKQSPYWAETSKTCLSIVQSEILSEISVTRTMTSNKGFWGRFQTEVAVSEFSRAYLGLVNIIYHLLDGLEVQWCRHRNEILGQIREYSLIRSSLIWSHHCYIEPLYQSIFFSGKNWSFYFGSKKLQLTYLTRKISRKFYNSWSAPVAR